jgi:hypothetical protein
LLHAEYFSSAFGRAKVIQQVVLIDGEFWGIVALG